MFLLNLDQFSSEFFFTLSNQKYMKNTLQGAILTLFVVFISLYYFIYLLNLYVNNQISPKFRSQTFIINEKQQIEFSSDLVGFVFQYNQTITIDELQAKQNLTYLVYIPQFYYSDGLNNITYDLNLDVIPCTDPSLKGLNCIDFSKINNFTLELDISNQIYSSLQINVYGCLDVDTVKTTIPSNCASQAEIDKVINGIYSQFYLKMKTQQYNTTSEQIQTNYRNIYSYVFSSQFIVNTLKTQRQETQVSQGLIFQQKQIYSSPYQYNQLIQSFDRKQSLQMGLGPYIQENIMMDELLQQFQIQYASIADILALTNSITFIIIFSRMIGRFCSKRLIQEDIFMLIFRNLFLNKTFQILRHNKFIEEKNDLSFQFLNEKQELIDDFTEQASPINKNIPAFETKFRDYVEKQQVLTINSEKENLTFLEEEEIKKQQSEEASNTQIIKLNRRKNIQSGLDFNDKLFFQSQDFSPTKQTSICIFNNKYSFQSQSKFNNSNQNSLKLSTENEKKQTENIFLNKKIMEDIISSKLKVVHSNKLRHAIYNLIFKFKFFKSKAFLLHKGIDHKQLIQIDQEAKRSQNIYQLYEDVIFLKKAVSMLLSQEQLAAIKLISLTDNYFNLDLKRENLIEQYKSMENKLNYFEKQFIMFQSEQLQSEYIQQFFMNYQNLRIKNEVDKRIISSITNIK
ncbi:AMP-binding enzyme family protein (macronuclear) [Tetrahymena thermophila SB210]|uniref:AMP-binding enzyme family protein n=1 Tax=Tetrahymena thermophila (strain SB210) TaxID=312017 RepID=W7XHY3_TETTS|nr:AMP-binding enzyme family protein [Tetrahymena thermophila SB210]EWS74166.1 AMP-binding enzyme family protein [Tetrahymena thermophila SB210]|eukprot:XP_012653306.1 AMP-binding enzyme family protein [Tetrahymena thermophila SB210]